MIANVRLFKNVSSSMPYLIFGVGLVLLLVSWWAWYAMIGFSTEALLVPWYCDCSWDTRPALGILQRTINDFFDTSGRELPSQLFILISTTIFTIRTWRAKNKTWFPLMFFLASLVFLVADLVVADLSWSLSDWMVGAQLGRIDAGYHRTWYGILSELALWLIFFVILIRIPPSRSTDVAKYKPAQH